MGGVVPCSRSVGLFFLLMCEVQGCASASANPPSISGSRLKLRGSCRNTSHCTLLHHVTLCTCLNSPKGYAPSGNIITFRWCVFHDLHESRRTPKYYPPLERNLLVSMQQRPLPATGIRQPVHGLGRGFSTRPSTNVSTRLRAKGIWFNRG
jgi:hypothetical protein